MNLQYPGSTPVSADAYRKAAAKFWGHDIGKAPRHCIDRILYGCDRHMIRVSELGDSRALFVVEINQYEMTSPLLDPEGHHCLDRLF